jgi:hypothetical protein
MPAAEEQVPIDKIATSIPHGPHGGIRTSSVSQLVAAMDLLNSPAAVHGMGVYLAPPSEAVRR